MPYKDRNGRILFISDGITKGEAYGTFYLTANGALRRFKAKNLIMRTNRSKAEEDLLGYAKLHGLLEVPDECISIQP